MKSTDENGVSLCRGREGGIAHMVRYGFIHTKEDIKFLVRVRHGSAAISGQLQHHCGLNDLV